MTLVISGARPSRAATDEGRDRVLGWSMNAHRSYEPVFKSWSENTRHGTGHPEGRPSSATQQGRAQYSSRLLALWGLRQALEMRAAERLRKVDMMIDEEAQR